MPNENFEQITRRSFAKRALGATAATLLPITLRDANAFFAPPDAANSAANSDPTVALSPYGVCSHLGGGEEHDQMPKNLDMMKAAGISWARADFSWSGIESPQGKWRFERFDRVVEETNKRGIQILPILDYDVPWATPAFKHLDAWLEYVRRVVKRYRDKIRYWEVWNEPNLESFWRAKPNGADYAILLKATYQAIKEIDPELVVVYGGLAGVPVDFFEASLDAGAGESFDVVNIHPYRGGLTTRGAIDRFAADVDAFRQALKKRGLADRPIWITEMGWATPPTFNETNARIIDGGLRQVFPKFGENVEPTDAATLPKVAFFYDDRYEPSASTTRDEFARLLPKRYQAADAQDRIAFVAAADLDALEKNGVDALILPPSETFPADCFDAFVRFVKNGGALFLLGGVPLYYRSERDEDGAYRRTKGNPTANADLDALRISWYAWWTRENVPEEVPIVVAPESASALPGYYPVVKGTRFFDGARLRDGDEMIPLLNGRNETFNAPVACVYKLRGDGYRGAVVVSSIFDAGGGANVSTVENQGVFLPQAYLLALANGIERYFWYEFHAPQRDPVDKEHHFGMVGGPNLEPKPGYVAFKAMTKARPGASRGANLTRNGDFCVVSWTRPDGDKGWAVWANGNSKTATLEIDGNVVAAFDYLGADVDRPKSGANRELSQKILYLIGPDKVEVK